MDDQPVIDEYIREAVEQLAGGRVRSIRPAKSGANSRIYRVESEERTLALKSYPAWKNDARNRAEVEWQTLVFLTTRGVTAVPQPFARDPSGRFLLMEWIDGAIITAHQSADLVRAADFVTEIFSLSSDANAGDFPLASEACLSIASIVRQIKHRLSLFTDEPMLKEFLTGTFLPAFSVAKLRVADKLKQDIPITAGCQRLIPADFGFHNVVRQSDGTLRYIDFEYFGWDDPVKLTADFLLHPAMQLSVEDSREFVRRMKAALPGDAEFESRLRCCLSLFALRWVLILFNPFRDDRLMELPRDQKVREVLLAERLTKAAMLLRLTDPAGVAALVGFEL